MYSGQLTRICSTNNGTLQMEQMGGSVLSIGVGVRCVRMSSSKSRYYTAICAVHVRCSVLSGS